MHHLLIQTQQRNATSYSKKIMLLRLLKLRNNAQAVASKYDPPLKCLQSASGVTETSHGTVPEAVRSAVFDFFFGLIDGHGASILSCFVLSLRLLLLLAPSSQL